ncbi:capsular biosynthesis protein [Helicobacter valdiviensis]|nr:capsular biosynthesis protein [Helicobacter valdiviensis]
MALLSIIIPFGTSKERPYILDRVMQKAREFASYQVEDEVEFIFVEGYSSLEHSQIPLIIAECGHQYYKDTEQSKYSIGACRNLGAICAKTPVIMPLDVDCYLSEKNLKKLLEFIKLKQIAKNPNAFLVFPCVYLTEQGTNIIENMGLEDIDSLILFELSKGKSNLIKFYTPASSSLVMHRHKFLELGGNDFGFVGHGYEDFEFMSRVFKFCAEFERMPRELSYDARNWAFNDFRGFRAWFSVVGAEMQALGMYLVHFWHIEPNQNGYSDNRELNHQRFYKRLKEIKEISEGPEYLNSLEALGKKVLLLDGYNSPVIRCVRGVGVYLGDFICKREYEFYENEVFNEAKFLKFVKDFEISSIVFPNPYGNEQRREIYNFVRERKLPFICFERGALPHSWFFDRNGCNYDSSSYEEKFWNKPLDKQKEEEIKEYIATLLEGNESLEAQGDRQNAIEIKRKYGIKHKRIIFVPLQMHTDTVIKYFTKEPFSFFGFLEILDEIAGELKIDDIVFLCKKHPLMLELDKKKYPNLIFVADNLNFIDLLLVSSMVVLINSGVGVYAMMANKPCVICGGAFYAINGVNRVVMSKEELKRSIIEIVEGRFEVDYEKVLRFIAYLYYEFYSYGKSTKELLKDEKNNRIIHRTQQIDFYKIRINGVSYLEAQSVEKYTYRLEGMAYKNYLYEIKNIKNNPKIVEKNKEKFYIKLSHTKFYRLFRKLVTRPKDFVMDSKNPLMKPIKKMVG